MRKQNNYWVKEIRTHIKAEERELRELKALKENCGSSIDTNLLEIEIFELDRDIESLRANLKEK